MTTKVWIAAVILLCIAGCSSRFQDVQSDNPIKWDTKTKRQCWAGKTEFDDEIAGLTPAQKQEMEVKASERGESDLLNNLAIAQHMAAAGFDGPLCSDLANPPSDPYVKAWWNSTFTGTGSPYVELKIGADVMLDGDNGPSGPYFLHASNLHYYVGGTSLQDLLASGFTGKAYLKASYNRLPPNVRILVQGACQRGLPIYEKRNNPPFPLINVCQGGTGDISVVFVTVGEMSLRDGKLAGRSHLSYLLVKSGKYYVGSATLHDQQASGLPVYFDVATPYDGLGTDGKSLVQDFCQRGLRIYEVRNGNDYDLPVVSVCQK